MKIEGKEYRTIWYEDGVVKMAITAPGLNFDGAISPIRRAGTGWNDVLKGIKKASGKDNTIEHY